MEYCRLKKGTLPPQPGPDPDELRNFRVFGWPLFYMCMCPAWDLYFTSLWAYLGRPWWLISKESACNAGDAGSILGLARSPGGEHGNSLQYFCLENPMDRGAWWAADHGVAELDTTEATEHVHTHGLIRALKLLAIPVWAPLSTRVR